MKLRFLMATLVAVMFVPDLATGQTPGSKYNIQAGESLSAIAHGAYGDGHAWTAIMLGTNSRVAKDPTFTFISDPNQVTGGQVVWIPDVIEKDVLVSEFDAYTRAVMDMSLPQVWELANDSLVTISGDSVDVVTWTRESKFPSAGTDTVAQDDIWVTIVPYFQQFCQGLNAGIKSNMDSLSLRIEQRLGMPPKSNNTEFVVLSVKTSDLFRPCSDPSVYEAKCGMGQPSADNAQYQLWFLGQYYTAYAQAQPVRYPWTSLGYTYDWNDLTSEVGESEFIVPQGAKIKVLQKVSTADYCR